MRYLELGHPRYLLILGHRFWSLQWPIDGLVARHQRHVTTTCRSLIFFISRTFEPVLVRVFQSLVVTRLRRIALGFGLLRWSTTSFPPLRRNTLAANRRGQPRKPVCFDAIAVCLEWHSAFEAREQMPTCAELGRVR